MNFFARLVLVGTVFCAAPAMAGEARSSSADTNMDILIQKVKADKKLLVASNMDLTEGEAKKFWPLYEQYQAELQRINLQLADTIKDYNVAFNKGPIPDDTAKRLLNEALSVELAELKLKHKYAEWMAQVVPKVKVVRYIQIENKIRAVLKMQLAADIPLVY